MKLKRCEVPNIKLRPLTNWHKSTLRSNFLCFCVSRFKLN